jgi:transposase-like protein
MTPTNWHSPLRCPHCQSDAGHPFSVQSNSSNQVIVKVRCDLCMHEWTLERETPTLAPKRDRRLSDEVSE